MYPTPDEVRRAALCRQQQGRAKKGAQQFQMLRYETSFAFVYHGILYYSNNFLELYPYASYRASTPPPYY